MRIAVDARCLAERLTGIGRYTHELLQLLIPRGGSWFLYSHRPLRVALPEGDVTVRCGNVERGMMSTAFAQLAFPLWARSDRVDLFWSPRHHLPLLLGRRIRRVVTIHDMVWARCPETMRRSGRLLERLLMPPALRSADRIIAVSQATAADIAALQPACAPRVAVVHEAGRRWGGVGEVPAAGPEWPRPYAIFIGTLEPRKNLRRVLGAFARVANGVGRDYRLVIVGGEGWGRTDLPALIEQLGLRERVSTPGYLPDASLRALLRQADFLVMPSLYEGFGLPLLEAMAEGVPVLTSSVAAMPEVAGDAGLLVDPLDEQAIARGMERLMGDAALRAALAARGRERARQFTWERAAEQTWSVLEQALQCGPRQKKA